MQNNHAIISTTGRVRTPNGTYSACDVMQLNATDRTVTIEITPQQDARAKVTRQKPSDSDISAAAGALSPGMSCNVMQPDATELQSGATYADVLATDLTVQQQTAAMMLAVGKGAEQVARHLGVHRATIWRWQALPAFEAYSRALVHEATQTLQEELLAMRDEAIETIRRVMQSGSDAAALRAAMFILEPSKQ